MAQLMLVNPKRRRKARHNPKRRKMSALQRQYFGGGRKAPKRRRRAASSAAPIRRRRRRHHRAASVAAPARRRHHRRRSIRGFARDTSGSLSLRSLSNPGGLIRDFVIPSAIGAAGALGLDVAYAMLPIPAQFKGGTFAPVVKAATVLGVGALASKVLPGRMVKTAVAASLTIMAYQWLRGMVAAQLPSVPLQGYISGIGYTGAGQFLPDNTMGEYVGGADSNVAWDHATYGDIIS